MTDRGRGGDEVFRIRRFAEEVVTILREKILSGEYEPGERINEIKLAETLKISRSPVREALQTLAGEGLVRTVSGRGAFVATFDVSTVAHLWEVRDALESAAAKLAAQRASEEDLDELELFLVQTRDALGDTGLPYPRDLDFHQQVLNMSGNPKLVEAARAVALQLQLARARSGEQPARAQHAYEEHYRIYQALRDRDPAAAAAATEDHLQAAREHVLHLFEGTDSTGTPAWRGGRTGEKEDL